MIGCLSVRGLVSDRIIGWLFGETANLLEAKAKYTSLATAATG